MGEDIITHDQGTGQYAPPGAEPMTPGMGGNSGDNQGVSQGTAGAEGGQPDQQNVQPQWNGQEWALNYKGQQIIPKDRQHLINLAQQGFSYSKDQQTLNERARQLEQQYGKYSQLDQAFQQNPQLASKVFEFVQQQNYQQPPAEGNAQVAQLPPEVLNKLQELDEFKTTFINRQAREELDKEINTLKSQYSDQPWDQDLDGNGTLTNRVLKHANDNEFPTLHAAFKDLMWDHYATANKANGMQQAQAQRQAQAKQGIIQQGGGPAPAQGPKNSYNKGDSYDDIAKKALAELGA